MKHTRMIILLDLAFTSILIGCTTYTTDPKDIAEILANKTEYDSMIKKIGFRKKMDWKDFAIGQKPGETDDITLNAYNSSYGTSLFFKRQGDNWYLVSMSQTYFSGKQIPYREPDTPGLTPEEISVTYNFYTKKYEYFVHSYNPHLIASINKYLRKHGGIIQKDIFSILDKFPIFLTN